MKNWRITPNGATQGAVLAGPGAVAWLVSNEEDVLALRAEGQNAFTAWGEFSTRHADRLGARRVAPLYGSVDPRVHRPAAPARRYALSYLGTYAADRQAMLERLLVEPARRRPESRYVIGGAQYPGDFPWTANIFFRGSI